MSDRHRFIAEGSSVRVAEVVFSTCWAPTPDRRRKVCEGRYAAGWSGGRLMTDGT